jgi:hypothetical protein
LHYLLHLLNLDLMFLLRQRRRHRHRHRPNRLWQAHHLNERYRRHRRLLM